MRWNRIASTLLASAALLAACNGRSPESATPRETPRWTPPPRQTPVPPAPPLQCDQPPVDPAAPPDCARLGEIARVRQLAHESGAIGVDLRLEDGCGRTLPRSYAACVDAPGAVVVERGYESATTLVLVTAAASDAEASELASAVRAFVHARPAGERIAVQRWGAALTQITDFTADRGRLARMIAAGIGGTEEAAPIAESGAVAEAQATVLRAAGVSRLERAAVVVFAPEGSEPAPSPDPAPVLWVTGTDMTPAAALAASSALDTIDAAGVASFGTCDDVELTLTAPEGPLQTRSIPLIAPLADAPPEACDAAAAATGTHGTSRLVELTFTEAQRDVYDQRLADEDKDDFELSVSFGGGAPVPATAHIRGQSSIDCTRKNYAVDLDGDRPRWLAPGLASDEFMLLSLCQDEAYTGGYVAYQLGEPLGLLPYGFRLVELRADGVSLGIYMVMGKPTGSLRQQHARANGVVRRANDGIGHSGSPDVTYAAPGADPLAAYEALLSAADSRTGAAMLEELDRRMDVDQLLRWVAFNSLLMDGDTVDEVFFLGTEARFAPDSTYFTVSTWDIDDIYDECHGGGTGAMIDLHGLSYCVEGRLERRILSDPAGYERYRQALAVVLAEITPERFREVLDATAADLLPFFEDPAVRDASREIGRPKTAAEAEEAVREELERLEAAFAARRAALQGGGGTP